MEIVFISPRTMRLYRDDLLIFRYLAASAGVYIECFDFLSSLSVPLLIETVQASLPAFCI
jgi:hypothetical protein